MSLGRLAGRALDLFVPLVPDQQDAVALAGETPRLVVHLGDQRAGRVDGLEAALGGLGVHHRRDAVGREHDGGTLGHLVELLDEDGAAGGQVVDDVLVVDDLLAHVDRRAVEVERLLDRDDRPVDAGAVAARSRRAARCRRRGACRARSCEDMPPSSQSNGPVAASALVCPYGPGDDRGVPRTAAPDLAVDRGLRRRLGSVWVEAEIAQLTRRQGVCFLTLRDLVAKISMSVTCRRIVLDRSSIPITEGARVVVHARPDFYPTNGTLSLNAREIRPVGMGELLARIEQRRQLLAAEGLFDAARKRPLPFLPRRIGLITGKGSAAEHDVLENARLRWPGVEFEVAYALMQGSSSAAQVITALRALDAAEAVDVIVIARGGGSVEDLLPFSDEGLVRAVAAAPYAGGERDRPRAGRAPARPRRRRPCVDADRCRQEGRPGRRRRAAAPDPAASALLVRGRPAPAPRAASPASRSGAGRRSPAPPHSSTSRPPGSTSSWGGLAGPSGTVSTSRTTRPPPSWPECGPCHRCGRSNAATPSRRPPTAPSSRRSPSCPPTPRWHDVPPGVPPRIRGRLGIDVTDMRPLHDA